MRNRRKAGSTIALILIGITATLIGTTPTAIAATTVAKSGGTLTITGDNENSNIRIIRDGRRIRVFDGADRLPITDGPATVNNIDTVIGNLGDGADRLTVDLAGGQFAPGLTPEGAGKSEIEFSVTTGSDTGDVGIIAGRSTADVIVLNGFDGFDVNADGDGEMFTGAERSILNGRGGDDTIALDTEAGGQCIGFASTDVTVKGGEGADVLSGTAIAGFALSGGAGDDELVPSRCTAAGTSPSTMSGGTGNDRLTGTRGADSLSGGDGKDIIRGGEAADQLNGDAGNDRLFGGADADNLNGGRDTDLCNGDAGADTFTRCETQLG